MNEKLCKNFLKITIKDYYDIIYKSYNWETSLDNIDMDILKEYIYINEIDDTMVSDDVGKIVLNKAVFKNIRLKYNITEDEFSDYIQKLYFRDYLSAYQTIRLLLKQFKEAIDFFMDMSPEKQESMYREIINNIRSQYDDQLDENKKYVMKTINHMEEYEMKFRMKMYLNKGTKLIKATKMDEYLYVTRYGYQNILGNMTSQMDEVSIKVDKSKKAVESLSKKMQVRVNDFYKDIVSIIAILIAAISIITTNMNTIPKIATKDAIINIMAIIAINMSVIFVILVLFWIVGLLIMDEKDIDNSKNKKLNRIENVLKIIGIAVLAIFALLFKIELK